MSEAPVVVALAGVHRKFAGRPVLAGIDLEVRHGETLLVLGGSGAGKSVLLKHINGLLRPDEGSVTVLGCNVGEMSEASLVPLRRRVSYIFQQGALFDSLSIGENVAFGLREHRIGDDAAIRERASALLARVGLAGSEDLSPAELSGGMRKRAALARGLAMEPDVILYDEPTAGLDPLTGTSIVELIREVTAKREATSLIVTHDLAAAKALGGRIVFLLQGRLVFSGDLGEAARVDGPVGAFVRAGGIHA
jgi:phospholipid/cholesterol/gamma-HCH transport system ATP-binding protein